MNRWTSYESKNKADWLAIDFGKPTEFRRVELAIYDDRGVFNRRLSTKLKCGTEKNGSPFKRFQNSLASLEVANGIQPSLSLLRVTNSGLFSRTRGMREVV